MNRSARRIMISLCTLVPLVPCASCGVQPDPGVDAELAERPPASSQREVDPSPELTAEDVVKIHLEALRENDEEDSGIRLAYRFASPRYRTVMGPFEQFAQWIKSPIYDMLLRYAQVDSLPLYMHGPEARKFVVLESDSGDLDCYLFILTRQLDGPHRDCWMIDAVIRGGLNDDSSVESVSKDAGR